MSGDLLPGGGPLNGRRWAGQQLLRLWLELAGDQPLQLVAADPGIGAAVQQLLQNWKANNGVHIHGLVESGPIQAIGSFFTPDPALGLWSLWRDATATPASFSLIGQIHTLCTTAALTRLEELSVENVFSWDALICSSSAGRQVVEAVLEQREERVAARAGVRSSQLRAHRPQLPVIPLPMPVREIQEQLPPREQARRALGLPAESKVVLWLGRLSLFSKTDPAPTYQVLERVAHELQVPLILVELGPDDTPEQGAHFQELRAGCQQLQFLRLGGAEPVAESTKQQAMAAADLAISLVDNVQETFGQSLVEALAAGLPVVASNWDGYRDLVDHGRSGFLIPSRWARVANQASVPLGWQHRLGVQSYPMVAGALAQLVQLDLAAAEAAVLLLLRDEVLRQAMGRQAAQQARSRFALQVVAQAYGDLFQELQQRRSQADARWQRRQAAPLAIDPVTCFAGFASDAPAEISSSHDTPRLSPMLENGRAPLWQLLQAAVPPQAHPALVQAWVEKHGESRGA
jgi:glycosyltransferase involved in cell wall biosynthesis